MMGNLFVVFVVFFFFFFTLIKSHSTPFFLHSYLPTTATAATFGGGHCQHWYTSCLRIWLYGRHLKKCLLRMKTAEMKEL